MTLFGRRGSEIGLPMDPLSVKGPAEQEPENIC